MEGINLKEVRHIIDRSEDGYLPPESVSALLSAAGIPMVKEHVSTSPEALAAAADALGYPLVMKVVGPVHKTDVGGVALGIKGEAMLLETFSRMKQIPGFEAVLIQPMISGMELFAGATYERDYGHVVMCGLGGIYVEALRDIATGLAPLTMAEADRMIRSLRSYRLLTGTRGQDPVDTEEYAGIIVRLSTMLRYAPEIAEMDMNPLIAGAHGIVTVDARIRLEKMVP
jgi:acetyltransferase